MIFPRDGVAERRRWQAGDPERRDAPDTKIVVEDILAIEPIPDETDHAALRGMSAD
jgi:hypothetical protein